MRSRQPRATTQQAARARDGNRRESEDQWSEFNGNGHTLVELQLTPAQMRVLVDECQGEKYLPLPARTAQERGLIGRFGYTSHGWYHIRIEPGSMQDITLSVLDSVTNRVFVSFVDT